MTILSKTKLPSTLTKTKCVFRVSTDFCSSKYDVLWNTVRSSIDLYTNFLDNFNSLITDGVFPDSDDIKAQRICEFVRNETAVLVIEIGAPTFMRTQQALRTSLGDKIANLGTTQPFRYNLLNLILNCSFFSAIKCVLIIYLSSKVLTTKEVKFNSIFQEEL